MAIEKITESQQQQPQQTHSPFLSPKLEMIANILLILDVD
jgi:hypothetical protein